MELSALTPMLFIVTLTKFLLSMYQKLTQDDAIHLAVVVEIYEMRVELSKFAAHQVIDKVFPFVHPHLV